MKPNLIKDENNQKYLTQIINLHKNNKIIKRINKDNDKSNDEINIPSFKVNKMSYFDVKNRNYKTFGFGKIKISKNDNDYINILFHDSSLQLRFQGLISIKLSSLSLDNNKKNCMLIKKIIGFMYYTDDLDEAKADKILTDIHLYFRNENDIDNFIDNLIHI